MNIYRYLLAVRELGKCFILMERKQAKTQFKTVHYHFWFNESLW